MINKSLNELLRWEELEMIVGPKILKEKRKHRKSCSNKEIYQTKGEAESAEVSYRSGVVLSTMDIYYCSIHRARHKGHNERMPPEEILKRDALTNAHVIQQKVITNDNKF